MPAPARSRPPARHRRAARFRLGLAGRVVLIACASASVAALADWVTTPLLMSPQTRNERAGLAAQAASMLAGFSSDHLVAGERADLFEHVAAVAAQIPGGLAVIYDGTGRPVATSRGDGAPAGLETEAAARREAAVRDASGALAVEPILHDGEVVGAAAVWAPGQPPVSFEIAWRQALVLALTLMVMAPFLLPLARSALRPVTQLERRIRSRAAADKTKLADEIDDKVLTPLLKAIDEAHARSNQATRKALQMAFADPVTRLPNRLRFVSRLDALIARSTPAPAGESEPAADAGLEGLAPRVGSFHLIICDLDGFRKLNVAHGPRVADLVLAEIAERLRAAASSIAGEGLFVGRLSADQFAVIAQVEPALADAFLVDADARVRLPMQIEDERLSLTAAFGASRFPQDGRTSQDLLKQAEIALKEAKRSAGPRRVFFDPRFLEVQKRQQRLEADLREGLDRGEFAAVFQPKVQLETGEIVGAEALARWRRPDGGVVSPGVFIPIAEELGLISRLGVSVMRDACFAAAGWRRQGRARRVAVNVSPHQFADPQFADQVKAALSDSGLPPDLLELEITESAAVSEPERVARIMRPLRAQGVRLAIDDFGTGHSNFTSITRLPFDVFKIDQQFIRALSSDPHAPAIVEMILAMAEAMGQETVAEGVETREQADFLIRRACTIGQGYYFSPPLPADEFEALLRLWRSRPASRYAA